MKFYLKALAVAATVIVGAIASGPAKAQPANYDGTYAGTQALAGIGTANYSQCLPGPFKRRLVIKGGTVSYAYNPTYQGELTGTISAGGDVSATGSTPTDAVKLTGKIDGDAFVGEISGAFCTYAVELKRRR